MIGDIFTNLLVMEIQKSPYPHIY